MSLKIWFYTQYLKGRLKFLMHAINKYPSHHLKMPSYNYPLLDVR